MTSTKGKRLNPFQHALKRPDTYIGSAKTILKDVWIFDDEKSIAMQKKIRYNPGLFNIVREILSNAIDNVWRSKESGGAEMKRIEITVSKDSGKITILNDGYCIPVRLEEYEYMDSRTGKSITEKLYPAEVFFGDMFSGTNYDDEETRKTSGRNGMGAKATNVFSKEFCVECTNPDDKAKFVQVYHNNGTERSKPETTSYRNKTGYTSISFIPDYKYFEYPTEEDCSIDEDFIALLKLYAHEVAMITGISVKYNVEAEGDVNSITIKIKNLEKYARLFFPDVNTNKMVSIASPCGDECVLVEGDEPDIEETEDISHISFVNGIRTRDGGIHIDTWRDTVISALVRAFNSRKPKKGEKISIKTTAKAIYPYLTMFVRTEVDRPRFASQTKDELTEVFDSTNKSVPYQLFNARKKPEKDEWTKTLELTIKKMLKWNFIFLLEEKLLAKLDRSLSRKENTSKRINMGSKADDANKAATKEAGKCTLHITEGLSAKTFVTKGIGCMENGKDYNGSFAIKGKFINVQNNTAREINNNEEVKMLKQILGLRHGIDYKKDENFNTLRYGKVMIVTDADDDGIHIRGLLLNYFYTEYPGLIERGFVESFSTAVTCATYKEGSKSKEVSFYSNPEFKRWYKLVQTQTYKGLDIKYYKGLGSIEPKKTPDYFKKPKIVKYFMEGDERDYMDLGFNEEQSDWRKEWITRDMKNLNNFDPDELDPEDLEDSEGEEESEHIEDEFVYEGKLGLSSFVDQQLIIYHRMALHRALPCIYDGLKESQRKILFGILSEKYKKPENVQNVAGAVKKITGYHHGGASLEGAITGMGQGFVGKNNIPLLQNAGQFGSRIEQGKDAAAPRYLATMEEEITRVIFSSLDDPLLERMMEDDKLVEYRHFIPIIPMILINGADGIASGWNTKIPNYNPLDIVEWIERWLDGDVKNLPKLVPWYRGFTGTIELTKTKSGDTNDGWISKGILEKGDKGWWHIKELPIGLSTSKFKVWLEYLETGVPPKDSKFKKKEVRGISVIRDYSSDLVIHFMIKPTKDFIPDMDTPGNLKILQKSKTLKNMVAIDENDYPHRFKSPEDILKFFCPKRLHYYNLRKEHILSVLRKDLLISTNRYRFVKGVVDKKLDLHKTKDVLENVLENKPWSFDKIPTGKSSEPSYDYLLSMQMRSMTVEKLEELKKDAEKIENEICLLESKTIKDLWKDDLAKFRESYKKFLKTRQE